MDGFLNVKYNSLDVDGKRQFQAVFAPKDFPEFHKKILSEGLCKGLLKMHFVLQSQDLFVYYEYDGFQRLEERINRWKQEQRPVSVLLCRMFSDIIEILLDGEDLLLTMEGFRLHPDTIYFNRATNQIALAYLPKSPAFETVKDTIQNQMINLIEYTEQRFEDEEWSSIGLELRERILLYNMGLKEQRGLFDEIARSFEHATWPEQTMAEDFSVKEQSSTTKNKYSLRNLSFFRNEAVQKE